MKLTKKEQVLKTLFDIWMPIDQTENISTKEAWGRVLSREYTARYSIPVVRASAMDGIAVESARFFQGCPDTKAWIQGKDYCRADTGDDFDDRFDAVIPVEEIILDESGLKIAPGVKVKKGMNIRQKGSTISQGELVGLKNCKLCSFDLACLAMGGVAEVEVYKRPRVAFVPTGSELIPLGEEVSRGKNIDCNSILAETMLREMGAEPVMYSIVKDQKERIEEILEQAVRNSDIVILSGGSSKGEEDFNAKILKEQGKVLFHGVAAAPGKPMCVALMEDKPVINIPGPPVAMLYGLEWCIRPMICRLLHIPIPKRNTVEGILEEEIKAPAFMEILCMMEVKNSSQGYRVKQKPWKGGSMADTLKAGAYYITELGKEVRHPGEKLEITLLRGEEYFK